MQTLQNSECHVTFLMSKDIKSYGQMFYLKQPRVPVFMNGLLNRSLTQFVQKCLNIQGRNSNILYAELSNNILNIKQKPRIGEC